MKSICLSIVLYLINSFSSYATSSDNAEAVLIEEIVLQEDQQQLKAHLAEKQKKEIILIGQVRSIPIPTQNDSKVVQVVWTGVKSKDKKRVLFKEPLISTFKSKKGVLPKGLKMSLYGNKVHLSDAIERLERGEDEQGSDELKADNPSSNERRLEDIEGKIKKPPSSRNHSNLDAPIEDSHSHDDASMMLSSESYRGDSPSSLNDGKSAAYMIRKPSNAQNNINGRRAGTSLRGNGRHAAYKKTPVTPSALSPRSNKDFVGSPNEGFDPLKISQLNGLEIEKFKMPLIEVEITKEGCRPTRGSSQ